MILDNANHSRRFQTSKRLFSLMIPANLKLRFTQKSQLHYFEKELTVKSLDGGGAAFLFIEFLRSANTAAL